MWLGPNHLGTEPQVTHMPPYQIFDLAWQPEPGIKYGVTTRYDQTLASIKFALRLLVSAGVHHSSTPSSVSENDPGIHPYPNVL
jgi:hypothetical protein